MKITYAFIIVIAFLTACGNSDNSKVKLGDAAKTELMQLNAQYDSALIASDTGRLKNLYAEEFSYTTPEGQVRNKSEQLANVTSGGLKLEFGKSDEVEVAVYDSAAIVSGRFMGKGIFKENIVDIKERYTSFWIKKGGKWQLVKEQGTFIK